MRVVVVVLALIAAAIAPQQRASAQTTERGAALLRGGAHGEAMARRASGRLPASLSVQRRAGDAPTPHSHGPAVAPARFELRGPDRFALELAVHVERAWRGVDAVSPRARGPPA